MGVREQKLSRALKRLRKNSGYEATYHKKNGTTLSLTQVAKGTQKWRFENEVGLSQHVETTDWIFEASQFTDFRRGTNEPFAGDLLSIDVGATDRDWYEVTSVNKERCWRFSDPDQTTIRVHSLFLRREAI